MRCCEGGRATDAHLRTVLDRSKQRVLLRIPVRVNLMANFKSDTTALVLMMWVVKVRNNEANLHVQGAHPQCIGTTFTNRGN